MELYIRDDCGFCAKVIHAAEMLDVPLTLRDVDDSKIADELTLRGGMLQVPYLVDSKNGIEMYESDDIIAYLEQYAQQHENNHGLGAS